MLEEPLARVIAVLDYIGDTAYPVVREIIVRHGTDHIVHTECTRVMAFFTEENGPVYPVRYISNDSDIIWFHGFPR